MVKNHIFPHWGFVDAITPNSKEALQMLESQMYKFYNKAASNQDYWVHAELGNEKWEPEKHPYHCHLRELIESGSKIIDFGCGSAHAYSNLKASGSEYIGI